MHTGFTFMVISIIFLSIIHGKGSDTLSEKVECGYRVFLFKSISHKAKRLIQMVDQPLCFTFRFRLYAGLAVLLANLLEGEGGLADTGAGGLVVYFVNVVHDGSNLLFQLGNNFFHGFRFLWVNKCF